MSVLKYMIYASTYKDGERGFYNTKGETKKKSNLGTDSTVHIKNRSRKFSWNIVVAKALIDTLYYGDR